MATQNPRRPALPRRTRLPASCCPSPVPRPPTLQSLRQTVVIDQLIRHKQQLPKSSATTSTRKTCNPQACTNQLIQYAIQGHCVTPAGRFVTNFQQLPTTLAFGVYCRRTLWVDRRSIQLCILRGSWAGANACHEAPFGVGSAAGRQRRSSAAQRHRHQGRTHTIMVKCRRGEPPQR